MGRRERIGKCIGEISRKRQAEFGSLLVEVEECYPPCDGCCNPWSPWTRCSTSCGKGLTVRERHCKGEGCKSSEIKSCKASCTPSGTFPPMPTFQAKDKQLTFQPVNKDQSTFT